MNVALLNERIKIQKNDVKVDDIGNHINEWLDYYSCHATVSGTSNLAEESIAGQTVDESDISFTIRYCKKASEINATKYRIIFRKEIYDIKAVDFMNFKKRCLKFRCKKARR